jgi:hypothetical protein
MMSADITLGSSVYSTTSVKSNSTIRKNGARPIEDPALFTVSHEVAKSGRINSVMIIDDTVMVPCNDTCQVVPGVSSIKGLVKFSYNPKEGRTDLRTSLETIAAELISMLESQTRMDQFFNLEH